MSKPILWYFADPMCSWCWGFASVISEIKSLYQDKIQIALNLGGLRPGTTQPMTAIQRDEILHHWYEVNKLSGQKFKIEQALPDGFIYDTEPASRAIVAFSEFNQEDVLSLFHDIQYAFYVNQLDVTNVDILTYLVAKYNIDKTKFLNVFNLQQTKDNTSQHFLNSRQAGVTGFPSLVFQHQHKHQFITRGFAKFDQIQSILNTLLK